MGLLRTLIPGSGMHISGKDIQLDCVVNTIQQHSNHKKLDISFSTDGKTINHTITQGGKPFEFKPALFISVPARQYLSQNDFSRAAVHFEGPEDKYTFMACKYFHSSENQDLIFYLTHPISHGLHFSGKETEGDVIVRDVDEGSSSFARLEFVLNGKSKQIKFSPSSQSLELSPGLGVSMPKIRQEHDPSYPRVVLRYQLNNRGYTFSKCFYHPSS